MIVVEQPETTVLVKGLYFPVLEGFKHTQPLTRQTLRQFSLLLPFSFDIFLFHHYYLLFSMYLCRHNSKWQSDEDIKLKLARVAQSSNINGVRRKYKE